jgi:hypothetical protein
MLARIIITVKSNVYSDAKHRGLTGRVVKFLKQKRAINPLIACTELAEVLPLQDAFRTVDWEKVREDLNNLSFVYKIKKTQNFLGSLTS